MRAVAAVPSLERLVFFFVSFWKKINSPQISLHPGASARPNGGATLIARNNALQYRLTESGPDFFERGTSESVL